MEDIILINKIWKKNKVWVKDRQKHFFSRMLYIKTEIIEMNSDFIMRVCKEVNAVKGKAEKDGEKKK